PSSTSPSTSGEVVSASAWTNAQPASRWSCRPDQRGDVTAAGRRRLALVHYTAAPVTGGVEAVLAAHARLLRRAGHDVRVVAGRGDCELVPELDSRHPEVEQLTSRLAAGRFDDAAFERLRT